MSFNPTLFDTGVYRDQRIADAPAAFAWDADAWADASPAERERWQREFRQRFAESVLGRGGWERPALDPVVVEVRQMDGYRRETIYFTTRPGLRAFGYLLVPDDCPPGGNATILCVPGHGRGVDTIVGIAEDGTQMPCTGQAEGGYANNYALEAVARGYTVFAMELTGFGLRRDAETRLSGSAGASTCHKDSMAALMLGETMAGWRCFDAMRGLDYLETRTDCVDRDRFAILGYSGGGLVSLFIAALDTRLRAAVVGAYFNTFASSVLSIMHCVCNFVPGLLSVCEMPDLAALVAPRALFVESGKDDPIFPSAAFEQAVEKAQLIYAGFGAPEQFGATLFDGGHGFDGQAAFRFLEGVLKTAR